MWHVTFYMSHVTFHMSCTMCQPSPVIFYLSQVADNNRRNHIPFAWKLLNDEKNPIIVVGKSNFDKVNI